MKAVILAGGKGTRLRPYTYVIPKPLMPIGSYPIIETILFRLSKVGMKEVIISCSYRHEILKVHVDEIGKKYGISLTYILDTEDDLGTVGPLAQMKDQLQEDFIVINGDTLSTIDYREIYTHHNTSNNILTIALYDRGVNIDFGVVETENERVVDYVEKPSMSFLVSMGVNVYSPLVFQYIPKGKKDFPTLVRELIEKKEQVGTYIFEGYWRDIGRQEDYDLANQEGSDTFKRIGLPIVETNDKV